MDMYDMLLARGLSGSGGSGGAVSSVNGQTGAVVLDASDVGAASANAVYTKTEIDQKLVGAMTYKGTKATTSELPSTGNTQGDVWHITADGSEWAWNGLAWENLGTVVDISGKQDTISDLDVIRSGAAAGATAVQPSAISDMATKTWVGQQGYLTQHQDISGKLNVAQGAVNAGKFMVVGSDGNITAVTMQTWQGGSY